MRTRTIVVAALAVLSETPCVYYFGSDDGGAQCATGGGWAGGSGAGGGRWGACAVGGGWVAGGSGGGTGEGWDGGLVNGLPVCASFRVDAGHVEPAFICGCTRRPGEGASALYCPTGVDVSVSAVIGPEGGTLELGGTPSTRYSGPFRVEIRPHALDAEVTIRITEPSVPPPRALRDGSPMYYLEPVDLSLKVPAVLTVPYENRPGPMNPMSIFMSTDDPCTLAPLTDGEGPFGSTSRFGWAVLGAPKNACSAPCP